MRPFHRVPAGSGIINIVVTAASAVLVVVVVHKRRAPLCSVQSIELLERAMRPLQYILMAKSRYSSSEA